MNARLAFITAQQFANDAGSIGRCALKLDAHAVAHYQAEQEASISDFVRKRLLVQHKIADRLRVHCRNLKDCREIAVYEREHRSLSPRPGRTAA